MLVSSEDAIDRFCNNDENCNWEDYRLLHGNQMLQYNTVVPTCLQHWCNYTGYPTRSAFHSRLLYSLFLFDCQAFLLTWVICYKFMWSRANCEQHHRTSWLLNVPGLLLLNVVLCMLLLPLGIHYCVMFVNTLASSFRSDLKIQFYRTVFI